MITLTGMGPLLGAIADDMTGATDLANTLVKCGVRTVQLVGVPAPDVMITDADAIVIALKSRTVPVADAVAWSRASLAWLLKAGVRQTFFKYCSTFDSTDQGNIGPVAGSNTISGPAVAPDLSTRCMNTSALHRFIYCYGLCIPEMASIKMARSVA